LIFENQDEKERILALVRHNIMAKLPQQLKVEVEDVEPNGQLAAAP
jgi:hypothetical protein